MNESIHVMSTEQLRQLWMDTTLELGSQFDREEALWEYWRRVAAGDEPFSPEELEIAASVGVRGMGNVLGELARKGRIPSKEMGRVRLLLSRLPTGEAVWAPAQLNAREALESLKSGVSSGSSPRLEALLAKGASWAAVAAMQYLSPPEQDALVTAAEQRKVFSRAQRHELREARRVSRK